MQPFSDIETYPELQTWTLINLYSGQEIVVTERQLITAFPNDSERLKIMSNRTKAWYVIENVYDPHKQNEII